MTKIIKLLIFIYALIFSMSSLSNSYSAEYQSIVKSSGEDVPSLLKKALNQTILKVLGSKREFNLNEKKIRELKTEKYIKEYQFIDFEGEEAIEVIINLRSLQKKLLDLNLGISFKKDPKISAWVLCKSDFSSIEAAKALEQKCKSVKKEFKEITNERGVSIIYPILDAKDISLFSLESDINLNELTFFNDRYPTDSWFFCEISRTSDWCYLPLDFNKNLSTLDINSKYKPAIGLNVLIDNLLSNERLNLEEKINIPYEVKVTGLLDYSNHLAFKEIFENVLFIKDFNLISLEDNTASYSFFLLSSEKNLFNFIENTENIDLVSMERDTIYLKASK